MLDVDHGLSDKSPERAQETKGRPDLLVVLDEEDETSNSENVLIEMVKGKAQAEPEADGDNQRLSNVEADETPNNFN